MSMVPFIPILESGVGRVGIEFWCVWALIPSWYCHFWCSQNYRTKHAEEKLRGAKIKPILRHEACKFMVFCLNAMGFIIAVIPIRISPTCSSELWHQFLHSFIQIRNYYTMTNLSREKNFFNQQKIFKINGKLFYMDYWISGWGIFYMN